jgi:hypothetical protein
MGAAVDHFRAMILAQASEDSDNDNDWTSLRTPISNVQADLPSLSILPAAPMPVISYAENLILADLARMKPAILGPKPQLPPKYKLALMQSPSPRALLANLGAARSILYEADSTVVVPAGSSSSSSGREIVPEFFTVVPCLPTQAALLSTPAHGTPTPLSQVVQPPSPR